MQTLLKQREKPDLEPLRWEYETCSTKLTALSTELAAAQSEKEQFPARLEHLRADYSAASARLEEARQAAKRTVGKPNSAFYQEQLRQTEEAERSAQKLLASFAQVDTKALDASVKTLGQEVEKARRAQDEAAGRIGHAEDICSRIAARALLEAYQQFLLVVETEGRDVARINGSLWWALLRALGVESTEFGALVSPDRPGSTEPPRALVERRANIVELLKQFENPSK
jgi:hypothetical protein